MQEGIELIEGSSGKTWEQVKQAFLRTEKTRLLMRGSIASLLLRAAGLPLSVLVVVLLARILGAASYGIYAYAISWLAFLTVPSRLGLDHVLVRYVAAYREMQQWSFLKGLLRFTFGVGLALAIMVALAAVAFVWALPGLQPELRLTLWISLAVLPIVLLAQLRQAALRGLDQPVLALIPESIVYPILLLGLVVGAYVLGGARLAVPQVALINGVAWLATFVLGTAFLVRALPPALRASAPACERPAWVSMIPPLVFIAGAHHLVTRVDILILGLLGTSREVGIYAVASRAAELTQFMFEATTFAGTSLFSRIYVSGDRAELQRFTRLATQTIVLVSTPVYLAVVGLAPWLLGFFGSEFVEGATVLRLLATAFFLSSLGGFVMVMLYMTGHQRDVAVATGVIAVVNVILCFLLVRGLGILGAAAAAGISLLLLTGALVVILYRRVGILSLPFGLPGARPPAPREKR